MATKGEVLDVRGLLPDASTVMDVCVVVMTRTGVTERFLDSEGMVLGRDSDCDVPISDGRISRRHLELRGGAAGSIVARDLGSRNGTRVDGRPMPPNQEVTIAGESVVTLGSTVVLFERRSVGDTASFIHDRRAFEQRVAALFEDGKRGGTRVGVVDVRVHAGAAPSDGTEPDSQHVQRGYRAHRAISRACSARHVVGSFADGSVWVVEPDATRDSVNRLGGRIEAHLANADLEGEMVITLVPDDATTIEELRARATGEPAKVSPRGSIAPMSMGALDAMIERVAKTNVSVLIHGETGAGKEVVARRVHERSPRSKKPMVSINCAAIAESLLESELFGHEKGAFTGAVQEKVGLLESAAGGTVFFDEIGEMPAGLQAKLLRVLEQREVLPVGAVRPRPIDVRFVFATHRSLAREVKEGRFREDLLFRINTVTLDVPPLRERRDEIASLAMAFLERAARDAGRPTPTLSPQALSLLERHAWPGNVRELRNVVERALILCDGDVIAPLHLPPALLNGAMITDEAMTAPPPSAPRAAPPAAEEATAPLAESVRAPVNDEAKAIAEALEKCAGNQTRAAKLLGISRRTLVKRLGEHNLPRPRK